MLLNRRGWSNFLSCRTCGRVWGCPECDVTLVLHRSAGRVSCHHCGHSERVPDACPDCGSVSIARHGAGTEQLGRELEDLVSPLPVVRLDTDSAAATGVGPLLERFEREPAAVLVGTQMVAKGHDFPDVTLGVVLDADATLRFPDFRAEERTFSLVCQLAGRSGRGRRGGRVIVQALEPGARPLRHAAAARRRGVHRRRARASAGAALPAVREPDPRGVLVARARSRGGPRPRRSAIGSSSPSGIVLGPAPLFRRQGRERSQLVVKAAERGAGDRRRALRGRGGRRRSRPLRGEFRGGRRPAIIDRSAVLGRPTPGLRSGDNLSMADEPFDPEAIDEEEPRLDPEVEARRVAAMSLVRRLGDPVLKSRATQVDRFDEGLRGQVARMAGIMTDALGVGPGGAAARDLPAGAGLPRGPRRSGDRPGQPRARVAR